MIILFVSFFVSSYRWILLMIIISQQEKYFDSILVFKKLVGFFWWGIVRKEKGSLASESDQGRAHELTKY